MAATALLFAACDKDEVGGPGDSHISQEVLAAFNARYPGAQDVRWSLRGDYAVANFFFEAARTESRANNAAWFENANGQWAMTETNIDFAALPQAVREGFDASKYTEAEGWTRTGKVDKLERKEVVGAGGSEGVTVVYVIGVTRTADGITTGMDLYFSTEGVLVNEVTNAADDGYEDYIPEKPAAGIEQQIQGYLDDNGGGSVIDVDREYGGTEVELVCGGYKHELYFDAQGNRIYAKIEYGRRDIGSAVPEAIYNAVAADQQLSSPNDIDDIEKWSLDKATADGISVFWCVEVETRHKEVDIYVNDSPVRIIPRPVIDMGNTGGNGLPVEDEIERFLNDTNVDLCFDTGHHVYGGGEPISFYKKWAKRIPYIHFKDCDLAVKAKMDENKWSFAKAVTEDIMVEPGKGSIDFAAMHKALDECGYDGWCVVEQDLFPVKSFDVPLEKATIGRENLRKAGF